MKTLDLGVFASGRGSNFEAILDAIGQGRLQARPRLLISNNPEAGALMIARRHAVPTAVVSRSDFSEREAFVREMQRHLDNHQVEIIALAGYMKKIPPEIIGRYRQRIVNIHPALLPSFGGRGMYGLRVHEAVLEAGCKVTGVSIHLVDEEYDRGPIIAQRCVPVEPADTAESLAERTLRMEHTLYPEVLQWFAEGRVRTEGRTVYIE
ncbi:MAG TPA: phosphoribosylglycinamide formyltransferase [bacterium]|nr:phosphoribosylglycinamide formyltransferase [bacterium]